MEVLTLRTIPIRLFQERELKEQVRKERDKEIERVIRSLEEHNQSDRDECERVAENRIK